MHLSTQARYAISLPFNSIWQSVCSLSSPREKTSKQQNQKQTGEKNWRIYETKICERLLLSWNSNHGLLQHQAISEASQMTYLVKPRRVLRYQDWRSGLEIGRRCRLRRSLIGLTVRIEPGRIRPVYYTARFVYCCTYCTVIISTILLGLHTAMPIVLYCSFMVLFSVSLIILPCLLTAAVFVRCCVRIHTAVSTSSLAVSVYCCLCTAVYAGSVTASMYCFVYIYIFLHVVHLYSSFHRWPWAADAEIKVPSVESIELRCSPSKAWSRSVHCHACYAYCQGFLPC